MSHSSQNDSHNRKRDQFSQPTPPRLKPKYVIGSLTALLVVLIVYMAVGGSPANAIETVTPGSDGMVRIPLANVNDGTAHFYQYRSGGKTVRFFVIKSSDGVYRAAADACVVCYRGKKGYHQEGDDMVCNNCGRHFASKDVNVITGSCNPDGVQRNVDRDNLLIEAADLDAKTQLF